LKPEHADAFGQLGDAYHRIDQPAEAMTAYEKAVALRPDDACSASSLAGLYRKLDRTKQWREIVERIRPLMMRESEYNRACFEAISDNPEEALKLVEIALKKQQVSRSWAREDPDLWFVRDTEQFRRLVG
jgi:tetratricopeptide (TPR) repeat protein